MLYSYNETVVRNMRTTDTFGDMNFKNILSEICTSHTEKSETRDYMLYDVIYRKRNLYGQKVD